MTISEAVNILKSIYESSEISYVRNVLAAIIEDLNDLDNSLAEHSGNVSEEVEKLIINRDGRMENNPQYNSKKWVRALRSAILKECAQQKKEPSRSAKFVEFIGPLVMLVVGIVFTIVGLGLHFAGISPASFDVWSFGLERAMDIIGGVFNILGPSVLTAGGIICKKRQNNFSLRFGCSMLILCFIAIVLLIVFMFFRVFGANSWIWCLIGMIVAIVFTIIGCVLVFLSQKKNRKITVCKRNPSGK